MKNGGKLFAAIDVGSFNTELVIYDISKKNGRTRSRFSLDKIRSKNTRVKEGSRMSKKYARNVVIRMKITAFFIPVISENSMIQ